MRTLEITSYIGCPNLCQYCPQDLLTSSYEGNKEMTKEQFRTILNNTPKDVRIDFSGFSEIFYHPRGAGLIKLASDMGFRMVLYTTLEGFDEIDLDILADVRFDDVCFHKYPEHDPIDFDRKVLMFTKYIQQGRIAEITPKYKWSRAGNVWKTERRKGQFSCLFAKKDFDHNVVLPNGDVYLCCQDYGLKNKIGNLYTTKYNDLNRAVIISASYSENDECICRYCELAQ